MEEAEDLSEISKINPVSEPITACVSKAEVLYSFMVCSLSAVPICESEQHQLFDRVHPKCSCT